MATIRVIEPSVIKQILCLWNGGHQWDKSRVFKTSPDGTNYLQCMRCPSRKYLP